MIKITTTEPGFLGSLGSEPDQEIIEKHGGEFNNELDRPLKVYIDGDLETWAGYDIPVFLDGTVKDKTLQKALIIHPNSFEQKECVLLMGSEYGYFMTEEDAKDFDMDILNRQLP